MSRKQRLKRFSRAINQKKYKSDEWLKTQWKNILHEYDEFNSPEGPFIPDLINRKFKYIIECDGSIHDKECQKSRDKIKDEYFRGKGFSVFRVKFMDFSKMDSVKHAALILRKESGVTIYR